MLGAIDLHGSNEKGLDPQTGVLGGEGCGRQLGTPVAAVGLLNTATQAVAENKHTLAVWGVF